MLKKAKLFLSLIIVFLLTITSAGCFSDDEGPEITSPPARTESIPNEKLMVYFIDVGQGDSSLIKFGNEAMLIDSGEKENAEKIIKLLSDENIGEITYLVATHPHADHIGGMAEIIKKCNIKEIYMPKIQHTTNTFINMLDAIGQKGLQINTPTPGESFSLGGAEVKILAPLNEYEEINNNSIVLKITYGRHSFLFTGDAQAEAENDILLAGLDINSTVIKAPHHGSNTSSTAPFVLQAQPEYAVFSLGAGNSYNHPHQEIIALYDEIGSEILRTDIHGNIIFFTDGETLSYSTGNNAPVISDEITNLPETNLQGSSEQISSIYYIGNIISRKFHTPICATLPKPENQITFNTKGGAVSEGYEPCKNCNP